MSFQTHKHHKQAKIKMQRKENDSFCAHHFRKISLTLKERASSFILKGSITVEAALSASFFFFAMLCLIYLLEVMAIETTIKSALHTVAKQVATESYVNPIVSSAVIENRLVQIIGEERLDKSFIVDGKRGLDCSKSKKYWNTTIMDLQVDYEIEIPIAMFRIPILSQEEMIKVKGWTGHEVKTTDAEESVMVYVTEYGIVYHSDMNCGYLELSLRAVDEQEIDGIRNQSGGKYKACSVCKKNGENQKVYITEYGTKYHKSLECSAIQRKMYRMPLDDVHGMGGCSKCVK